MAVYLGIDVIASQNFRVLEGKHIGLYTNPSGVSASLRSTYDILLNQANINLVALFAPEHGAFASAQDSVHIDTATDSNTGIPIYSLYGNTLKPTAEMMEDIDVIIVDIQDIGVRYYTYTWTLTYLLEACGQYDVEMMILDRPNPLGGKPAGPVLSEQFSTFVGRFPVSVQHGLTIGEMAILVNQNWNPYPASLTVIPCQGWTRDMQWLDTDLPWVPPSPNMPHFSTVLHYPGSCLLEGTNLSEGRGTTLPFEIVGAPWIDSAKLADKVNGAISSQSIMPTRVSIARPHTFRPTISKFAGEDCHGIQLHVNFPRHFNALETWLIIIDIIRNLYPDDFKWLEPPTPSEPYHFDRLIGVPNIREEGNLVTTIKRDSSLMSYTKLWDNLTLYDVRKKPMPQANKTILDTSVADNITALIDQHLPDTFPALSICVYHQGDIVLNHSWGWISPEQQDYSIETDTLFDLASVTKLFVESAFLTLVSDAKVTLDTPLTDVIPEFAKLGVRTVDGGQDPFTKEHLPPDPRFKDSMINPHDVTFRHLLTHTSGLPSWRDVYNQASDEAPRPPHKNEIVEKSRWGNALKAIVRYPFVGTVGDTIRYSDIGLMLLGEAVARLNGSTLDTAIYDLICKPLGLESVTYNPVIRGSTLSKIAPTEIDKSWRKRRVWGEVHDENANGIGGVAGHAGLFATANDVARFGLAWLSGDENLSINSGLRQQATQEQANGQFRLGLGWMLKATEGSSSGDLYSATSYGHTGFTGTSLWIDPEQHIVSAVLTNRVYHGRDPEGIHTFRRAIHDLIVQGIRSL